MSWDRRIIRRVGLRKMRPDLKLKSTSVRAIDRVAGLSGQVTLLLGRNEAGKLAQLARSGRASGRTVYRVDCSKLFSEYIGETEKNLSTIFGKAERRGWILFFDEADALFGKRTGVKDAHDRYANQEVSYLLRRMTVANVPIVVSANDAKVLKKSFLKICSKTVEIR